MSHIAEMARAEADAAEAADPDTEPEPEPDAEPEPEPEPVAKGVDPEKAFTLLAKEDDKHAKAVARIMGDDFALVYRCQHCVDLAAGFTFTPPDEVPPMLQPDEYERCDRCNGHGAVLTGAVSAIGHTQTCTRCSGQGFTQKPVEVPVQPTPAQLANPNHSLADQLRAQGFTVLEPYQPQAPQAG